MVCANCFVPTIWLKRAQVVEVMDELTETSPLEIALLIDASASMKPKLPEGLFLSVHPLPQLPGLVWPEAVHRYAGRRPHPKCALRTIGELGSAEIQEIAKAGGGFSQIVGTKQLAQTIWLNPPPALAIS
jgi:hypothetical protein